MAIPTWPGWETVRELGRGSFGSVYEIRKQIFDYADRAALKVISLPQSSSEINELYNDGYDAKSISERFQSYLEEIVREYKLMSELKGNPNIVYSDDVYYVQHGDGIGWDIYIKMELLTPFANVLTTPADEQQVIHLATDMCNALAACRKKNIVHRDIKPQNIFVSQSGDFKLGDFGIAKTAERTTSGTKTGTYRYMAPEVYNNQPYGPSVDIYSLGMVLYWMLNDRRTPFLPLPPAVPTATQDDEALRRRMNGDAIPAPARGSDGLKRIVLRACAYDPKARYASAEEMLEDLLCLGADRYSSRTSGSSEDTCGTQNVYGTQDASETQNARGAWDAYGTQDTYGTQNSYGNTMGAGFAGAGHGQQTGDYGNQTMGNSWSMNENDTTRGRNGTTNGPDGAFGNASCFRNTGTDGDKTQGVHNTNSYGKQEDFGDIFSRFFENGDKIKVDDLSKVDGVIPMTPEALREGQVRTVRHPYDASRRFQIQISPGARFGQKLRVMDQRKSLYFEIVRANVVLQVEPTRPFNFRSVLAYYMTIDGKRIGVTIDKEQGKQISSVGRYIGRLTGYSHLKVDVYLDKNHKNPTWSVQVPHIDIREGYAVYIILDLPKQGWVTCHAPELRVEYRKL